MEETFTNSEAHIFETRGSKTQESKLSVSNIIFGRNDDAGLFKDGILKHTNGLVALMHQFKVPFYGNRFTTAGR